MKLSPTRPHAIYYHNNSDVQMVQAAINILNEFGQEQV